MTDPVSLHYFVDNKKNTFNNGSSNGHGLEKCYVKTDLYGSFTPVNSNFQPRHIDACTPIHFNVNTSTQASTSHSRLQTQTPVSMNALVYFFIPTKMKHISQ